MRSLADVFADAADHMEAYGHAKGTARDLDGSVCLVGALQAVCQTQLHYPAIVVLREKVGGSIMLWNDAPERTADQAISALRDCAIDLFTAELASSPATWPNSSVALEDSQ